MTVQSNTEWYRTISASDLPSPVVLVFRDRVNHNIEAAIEMAGGPDRLRPHVKTHKSAAVVALHRERGVTRFKCATTAEAEMLLAAGITDVLLAYQPVGPAVDLLCNLARAAEGCRLSCLVDTPSVVQMLETICERRGVVLSVFVDLDVGMHRTGIGDLNEAAELYRLVAGARWLRPAGIHAYDGHVGAASRENRSQLAAATREKAAALRDALESDGLAVPEIVFGGTPSFVYHTEFLATDALACATVSPGTYVYSDYGYSQRCPELPFVGAAVVLGRVVSVPMPGRFTVDVGSKAISTDPAGPRGMLLDHPEATPGPQSEEHWVWETEPANTPEVGMPVYVWPTHICPTIEHYNRVAVVGNDQRVIEWWEVTARSRGPIGLV